MNLSGIRKILGKQLECSWNGEVRNKSLRDGRDNVPKWTNIQYFFMWLFWGDESQMTFVLQQTFYYIRIGRIARWTTFSKKCDIGNDCLRLIMIFSPRLGKILSSLNSFMPDTCATLSSWELRDGGQGGS